MKASIALECPACGRYHRYLMPGEGVLVCPHCGHGAGTQAAGWSLEAGCPLCACRHLYRRKDFNQLLGLGLMVAGGALAIAFSYWFLLLFSLADLGLSRLVPDVAVCHRCGAEMRSAPGVSGLPVFDHHTADIYQNPAG